MPSLGAALDACVLIPASLRSVLLRAAAAGLYRAHWSDETLEEIERNLVPLTNAARARQTVDWLRSHFAEATIYGYEPLVPVISVQQEDRHVVAAAVVAGAQIIVTKNLQHFPDEGLTPFGIEAQSPDEFLETLFSLDPDLMAWIAERQAAALVRPPMSVEELLDVLVVHVPGFVRLESVMDF